MVKVRFRVRVEDRVMDSDRVKIGSRRLEIRRVEIRQNEQEPSLQRKCDTMAWMEDSHCVVSRIVGYVDVDASTRQNLEHLSDVD